MNDKEIEKKNFILWYGLYATEKELEVARLNNREILDRLLREYAEEVDKIDRTRSIYERMNQTGNRQTQGFDATLHIDRSSLKKNDLFEEDSVIRYEIR
ncbi:MAG: hypothetical protein E3K32_03170 [wastewater metagenome]|nr:hypothetical protein [Candidatus Loosdrechtia aerotolerans]